MFRAHCFPLATAAFRAAKRKPKPKPVDSDLDREETPNDSDTEPKDKVEFVVHERLGDKTERLVRRFRMERADITPIGFFGAMRPFWNVDTALEKDLYLCYKGLGGADNMMSDRAGWAKFSAAVASGMKAMLLVIVDITDA